MTGAAAGPHHPERLAAAAGEVRLGRTVTLAAPLAGSGPDNPEPGLRHMKHLPGEASDVPGLSFGLVAITVTGLVYHVALSRLFDLEGWHQLGNQLVHTAVPVLAVAGWLLFGPRRLTSARVAWLSLLFPLAWIAFTLIRGAGWHWYPYPFIDVTTLGYGKVALNCVWVALLLLGLAAGATLLDRRLAGPAAEPARPRQGTPADL